MKTIIIADATLRCATAGAENALEFKEKLEIVRQLNRLHVDVIETAPLKNGKSDVLLLHSIAAMTDCVLSCPVILDESAIRATWDAIKSAAHPRLLLLAPVSTVQMEYQLHKKPPVALEAMGKLTRLAKDLGAQVEVALLDATRAEREFLVKAANTVVENGADIVSLCDSAGTLFPPEFVAFISSLIDDVPALKNVQLSVECSDALHMATASAAICVRGEVQSTKYKVKSEEASTKCQVQSTKADLLCTSHFALCTPLQFRTAIASPDMLSLRDFADLLHVKGRELDVKTNLNITALHKIVGKIEELIKEARSEKREAREDNLASRLSHLASKDQPDLFLLSSSDDMESVAVAVSHLGYELSADDLSKVYEEVCRISDRKKIGIGLKDLDAIVATVALQAPPVYRLKSFVINSGNEITAMANVTLEKNGQEVQGFSIGDGPVDAAFLSIENILGRHFELDDFKISAVTEGREAVGSSVVRLRSRGKLYSGKGVSTDIIGAAIRAYINALNKICYDEEEKE